MAEKDTDVNKVADFFFGTPPNVKAKRARGEEVPLITPVDILSKFGVSEEKIDQITRKTNELNSSINKIKGINLSGNFPFTKVSDT